MVQRVLVLVAIVIGFWTYKTPGFYYAISGIVDVRVMIGLVLGLIVILHFWAEYLERRVKQLRNEQVKVRVDLKEAELNLTRAIEPQLLQTIKAVVARDMKQQLKAIRDSEEGCTEKCRLKNKILELDLERHRSFVQTLLKFNWCDDCVVTEPGAVKTACRSNCGR